VTAPVPFVLNGGIVGIYLTIENFKIYARESARTEHPRASLY